MKNTVLPCAPSSKRIQTPTPKFLPTTSAAICKPWPRVQTAKTGRAHVWGRASHVNVASGAAGQRRPTGVFVHAPAMPSVSITWGKCACCDRFSCCCWCRSAPGRIRPSDTSIRAERAARQGDDVSAYLFFAQAKAFNPADRRYALAADMARKRAAQTLGGPRRFWCRREHRSRESFSARRRRPARTHSRIGCGRQIDRQRSAAQAPGPPPAC